MSKEICALEPNPDKETVKMINSSRAAQKAPSLEMPKPHQVHHRALLWDTVYCDVSLTQSLPWLHLRALSNMLHAVPLDPREPPPAAPKRVHADVSPDMNKTSARAKSKGTKFQINNLSD